MKIKNIKLENYTVFKNTQIEFNKGINVFIGENATGKTHLLKLLYSACHIVEENTTFANKIAHTMMPHKLRLSHLVSSGQRNTCVSITAFSEAEEKKLTVSFNNKTFNYDADIIGEESWKNTFVNNSSIFIPSNEILSCNFNSCFYNNYIDTINSAKIGKFIWEKQKYRSNILKRIEQMINGEVEYNVDKDEFYLKCGNYKQEFNIVAEGIKKLGLLWLLIDNGKLDKGSVLFWDNPEANINPAFIENIVQILLDLEQNGVQIFLTTHDYCLAKYLEIMKNKEKGNITFYSLCKNNEKDGVQCEQSEEFTLLNNNPIVKTYLQLYRKELGVTF